MMRRKLGLIAASVVFAVAAVAGGLMISAPSGAAGEVTVYKTPWCGCCGDWVAHMRDNDFSVIVKELADLDPVKANHGVSDDLASCHTALVDGYVLEGHVPADDVKRLLAERPKARGLAVPGMPIGSPGMEQGNERDPYQVILFGETGKTVYNSYR